MRTIFLLLIAITFSLFLNAQVSKTVNIGAGGLASTLTPEELTTVTHLTVTGTIDARDFKTMRDDMPLLAELDLSETTIAAYSGDQGTGDPWNSYPANEIPTKAFYIYNPQNEGKTTLTSVILPTSITSLGQWSFATCTGLTGPITMPASVTSIGDYAFFNCTHLAGPLSIPSTVSYLGEFAFAYCSKLTGTLELPSAIASIGNNTFIYCSGLTGPLTIPSSVTTIGESAFYSCSGFDGALTLPSSLTSIGRNAFTNCGKLTGALTIPPSVTAIGSQTFEGCSGLNGPLTLPSSLTSIGGRAFIACSGLTGELKLPSSLTSIGESAFYGCSGLTGALTIPSLVTSIGGAAFFNCTGFNGTLTLPASLTEIKDHTFYGCIKLTGSVVIPSSVTSIGRYAFQDCMGLSSITIPASVTSLPEAVFFNCKGLNTIHVQGDLPIDLTVYPNVFFNVNFSNCKLMVPCGTSSLYANAQVWKTFARIKEENCPPVANAGPDQTVFKGSYVTLDGTASTSESGQMTYGWTVPSEITPNSISEARITFNAPEVAADTTFVCTLTVKDGLLYSKADSVLIFVKHIHKAAVVQAGTDQTVDENTLVSLYASATSDFDNDVLTYLWTAPEGITLNSSTVANPTFTAPEVSADTTYMISVVVNNGTVDSEAEQVAITVKNVNKLPVAKAGANQSVEEGAIFSLDGSASSDPDKNPLTFQWTSAAGITLSSTTAVKPTFTAPEVKENTKFVFSLIVSDGMGESQVEQIEVTVLNVNKVPVANCGVDQTGNEGTTVTLDGSLSSDPDEDPLKYKWTAPAGIMLSSTNAAKPTFTAPEVKKDTILTFTLVVNDGTVDSEAKSVKVSVKNVIKAGIGDLNASLIKAYPNPTHGIITVETGQYSYQKVSVSITDALGTAVYKKELTVSNSFQVDLSHMTPGYYVLRVMKGEECIYRKPIVKD
jgi:uncharacterized protein YdeI (BOF family)